MAGIVIDKLAFQKGTIVGFKVWYRSETHHSKKQFFPISRKELQVGILIGKTVRYEGKVWYGNMDEPNSFIPEKSITFWLVEQSKNNRYIEPVLVREEDLVMIGQGVLYAPD